MPIERVVNPLTRESVPDCGGKSKGFSDLKPAVRATHPRVPVKGTPTMDEAVQPAR